MSIFSDPLILKVFAWCIMGGIALTIYLLYFKMPDDWREWIRGRKTNTIAIIVFATPEVLTFLGSFEDLGLYEYVPTTWQARTSQGIALSMIVLRLWSMRDRERGDD